MEKSKLEKLRTLCATKEMMQKAKSLDTNLYTSWNSVKIIIYEYGMFLRCQQLGNIIKIAFFFTENMRSGNNKPTYEVFINTDGDEFITRDLSGKTPKWREAKLDMLEWPEYTHHSIIKKAWINQIGNKTIKTRLKTKSGGYEGILEYQLKIRQEDLKQKYRRETGPWDMDMERVPDLPKDWNDWWKKEAITENFIFYEYKKNGAKVGYCSYCETEVPIIQPKHGHTGTCMKCKKEITYKSSGKIKTLSTKVENAQLIQEITGGFVLRTFEVRRYYPKTYQTPQNCICEIERSIFDEDLGYRKDYAYELYRNRELRWVGVTHRGYHEYYCGNSGIIYTNNLETLEKTVLLKTALPLAIRGNETINCLRYLQMEHRYPILERITKAGLTRLTVDVIKHEVQSEDFSEKESELAKALKIDQERLKRLRSISGGAVALKWFQKEKQANTIYKMESIEFFQENNLVPNTFSFLKDKMSVEKIVNYLIKQRELSNEPINQLITTWKDYLNMATKAKLMVDKEMIYKPKNLRAKHGEMVALSEWKDIEKNAVVIRKQFKNVENHCKELGKYEYADEKYTIIAPKSIEDIIVEGITLQHCIHTCDYYFERINTKETFLLFLRRTGEEKAPYYTLEIEPSGNIRQKRTTGDNQNKDFQEAIPFLKKWQKVISERLTELDKELGKKSNEMRKKELEKLKKEQKRVRNGPLSGKLLAEVLEQDFMDAEAI